MLSGLKLYRQPPAQIPEKQARSIKYPLTVAKLLLAKDIDDFVFKDTPINEGEVPNSVLIDIVDIGATVWLRAPGRRSPHYYIRGRN